MTEVDYGGGGHRTRLRKINDQLVCLWGAPGHVYKGVEEVGEGRALWHALEESYSHRE